MAFRVTQCPSCESTFNTSQRVLEVAAGKVRCGACLTVFSAADNFLGDEEAEAVESVFVSAAPADYFDPSHFLTRNDLRETEPEPDSLEFFAAVSDTLEEVPDEETEEESAEEEEVEEEPSTVETEATDTGATPRWLALHTDTAGFAPPPWLPGAAPVSQRELTAVEAKPPAAASAPESFALHFNFTLSAAVEPPARKRPDPTAISLSFSGRIEAPEADAGPEANDANLADFNEEIEASDFQDTVADSLDDREADAEASVAAIRARALQAELEDDEALDAIPQENLAALRQFSSPVEFFAGQSRRWRRQAGWGALALLLAVLLAGQYLWREMPTYSQSPRLRPLYASVCELAGCELPTYSDITAIRSDILTVRSHPEVDDALAINIEFRNTAPFAQPFPVMVLSFNTASNNVMALREFAPSEYLGPVLARRELMPVMNPVQVRLEIIDPGPDAVNYTLAFRRP